MPSPKEKKEGNLQRVSFGLCLLRDAWIPQQTSPNPRTTLNAEPTPGMLCSWPRALCWWYSNHLIQTWPCQDDSSHCQLQKSREDTTTTTTIIIDIIFISPVCANMPSSLILVAEYFLFLFKFYFKRGLAVWSRLVLNSCLSFLRGWRYRNPASHLPSSC